MPTGQLKSLHVNLLKAWIESKEVRVTFGEEWNWPAGDSYRGSQNVWEDDADPFSPGQWSQVAQVIKDVPEVFKDALRTALEREHKITTSQGIVVRSPIQPVPIALQKMLQEEVDKNVTIWSDWRIPWALA